MDFFFFFYEAERRASVNVDRRMSIHFSRLLPPRRINSCRSLVSEVTANSRRAATLQRGHQPERNLIVSLTFGRRRPFPTLFYVKRKAFLGLPDGQMLFSNFFSYATTSFLKHNVIFYLYVIFYPNTSLNNFNAIGNSGL